MMLKPASFFVGAVILACVVGVAGQGPQGPERRAPAPGQSVECSALTGRTFDNGTSIVESTLVTSGTLRISDTVTIPNLPPFCRVQGVSKPSADSDIRFEVWLPQPAAWNRKFLSTGEGGFAGQLNYQRNGQDGAMDEILRRGYATASTDTGHRSSDQWWADRPSGKSGRLSLPSEACDHGCRQSDRRGVLRPGAVAFVFQFLLERRAPGSHRGAALSGRLRRADYRRALEFSVAFERGFHLGRPGTRGSGRGNSRGEASRDYCRRGRRVRQERRPGRRRHRRSAKLQVRSAVADVPRRGWQQLPDAAAGGGASENL